MLADERHSSWDFGTKHVNLHFSICYLKYKKQVKMGGETRRNRKIVNTFMYAFLLNIFIASNKKGNMMEPVWGEEERRVLKRTEEENSNSSAYSISGKFCERKVEHSLIKKK